MEEYESVSRGSWPPTQLRGYQEEVRSRQRRSPADERCCHRVRTDECGQCDTPWLWEAGDLYPVVINLKLSVKLELILCN